MGRAFVTVDPPKNLPARVSAKEARALLAVLSDLLKEQESAELTPYRTATVGLPDVERLLLRVPFRRSRPRSLFYFATAVVAEMASLAGTATMHGTAAFAAMVLVAQVIYLLLFNGVEGMQTGAVGRACAMGIVAAGATFVSALATRRPLARLGARAWRLSREARESHCSGAELSAVLAACGVERPLLEQARRTLAARSTSNE